MKIKILSPVHIGSGEKKTKLNFIIKNNIAYFINEEMFRNLIHNYGLTDKFVQWVSQRGKDLSQFLKDHPVIEKKLLEKPIYTLQIKGSIEREVNLHIKDSNNRFYIPGSSIKGAIRTALLYTVLEEWKPDKSPILHGVPGTDIKGVLGINRDKGKWAGIEIEKLIFRAGFQKDGKTISYSDAKYDLLKFIHISDAYPMDAKYSIIPVRTLSSFSETSMNFYNFVSNVEAIDYGEFNCSLEIDMMGLLMLKDLDKTEEWLGLEERFTRVFGFNLYCLNKWNLQIYQEKIIKRLLEACERFSQKKKEKDLELISFRDRSLYIRFKKIRVNGNTLDANIIKNNYPEIREGSIELGFGSGWKGKTVGLYFDKDTINEFRKLFKGRWSGKFSGGEPLWPFPKTIRLAFWLEHGRLNIFPIGWVEISKE
jgi:CRISPR-associated protein Csm5